jgi:hypothetical protein
MQNVSEWAMQLYGHAKQLQKLQKLASTIPAPMRPPH